MALFVLVHGSWHGPWVWGPVALELRKRGHEVVAPELPIDEAGATWRDYADRVAGAVGDRDQETILVGHSAGAIPVAIAASDNAPRLAVYLTPSNPARELPEDRPVRLKPELDVVVKYDDQGRDYLCTRPYRPQTNGKPERFIRTMTPAVVRDAVARAM